MQRKRMIIDRKFQLKTIFSVALIAMIFFFLVIGVVGFFSLTYRLSITEEIVRLQNAVETENNIATAFIEYASKNKGNPVRLSIDTVTADHEKSMAVITSHIRELERYTQYYFYLVIITVGAAVAVILVYYLFLLRLTHRISGPISVISKHVQDMIDGNNPQFRSLREKDEFKELYAKIETLAARMKRRK